MNTCSHVMFDFDGTLSWLRHGWPEIMLQTFWPHFPLRAEESDENVRELLLNEILSLNGKPSIFQVERFRQLVAERGGKTPSSDKLLRQYQDALDAEIEDRARRVLNNTSHLDEFVIFGARRLLQNLKARNLTLIILSGTIEHRVKQEAKWLGLAEFFGNHIYGSTPDPAQFSKRQVIDRILREENISGGHLLSFGDGPVEIAETKAVGGIAIGVASDENINGSGKMDEFKRRILLDAGADFLMADYRDAGQIMERWL